ncbi:hypothetical protein [Burkholderia cepacia]|uniref:hypothetical protein n=1 Tax=Burkholderia cepacia TaxID=292 RepID=UPI0018C6AE64|nr:hypothetical protein [Burkholderia cepacia]
MKLEASISSSPENVVLRLDIDELPAYFEKRAAPDGATYPRKMTRSPDFTVFNFSHRSQRGKTPFRQNEKGPDGSARLRISARFINSHRATVASVPARIRR